MEPGPEGEPPKVILDSKVLRGKIKGLMKAKVNLGDVLGNVDLTLAKRLTLKPIPQIEPDVFYRIVVFDGQNLVGEMVGNIHIYPTPGNRLINKKVTEFDMKPPVLKEAFTEIKLPAPIDDVVVGAGGRLLVFHLKKLQQLAVFDVSQTKLIKYIPLQSNNIVYAAGAQKLFIGLCDARTIQRWDLATLERELTVDAPEGGVGAMAIGPCSTSPLILLAGTGAKNSYLIEPESMQAAPLAWRGWRGGAWGPVHVHVSYDGSTAIACGGGWAGIEIAKIVGGRIIDQTTASSVHGDTLVAGNGALVFPDKGGIIRSDLANNVKGIEGTAFPAIGTAFSLAYSSADTPLTIFPNHAPRRIANVRDLTELRAKSNLPIHKRVI